MFIIRKIRRIRNRILGIFNFWPVSSLNNTWLRSVPYFCISMQVSQKRRRLLSRQVSSLSLSDFRFVDATVGSDLDLSKLVEDGLYDDEKARHYHDRPLTPGEIGLSLTHARIYKMIVDSDLDEAVILEDDVLFLPRNLDTLRRSSIPPDFDVLFFHAELSEDPPRGHFCDQIFSDDSYVASSVAYLVSRKGARKLLAAALPVAHASDGFLGRAMKWDRDNAHRFRQQGVAIQLSSYIIHPPGVLNGSSCNFIKSTIAD
ncbi:hypothetical protein C1J03_15385 [Sulfitobacter sp. SK012]|uniref:glycosyltransferase family 25 protein n=1 Tax=Sulfitobacter sp. SK012 TaxID=1389005 RepID=UPI000E0A765C|nr:glycosyltransferase family 25 protein [Sulfitobacter sp. SK012]AXI47270.1 hypothetical protein C1J03_15385 [Sulfitobacter sp. SK012]